MMSTRGSKAAARAMAMAWRWPPESISTRAERRGMRISSASSIRWPSVCIRRAVDERAAGQFAAEEEVAGHVDVVAEAEILVDHLDAGGAGRGGAGDPHRFAVERDGPVVGDVGAGENLGQGRFAGGVVADQPEAFAGPEVEIDAAQRLDRAEALVDAAQGARGVRGA